MIKNNKPTVFNAVGLLLCEKIKKKGIKNEKQIKSDSLRRDVTAVYKRAHKTLYIMESLSLGLGELFLVEKSEYNERNKRDLKKCRNNKSCFHKSFTS